MPFAERQNIEMKKTEKLFISLFLTILMVFPSLCLNAEEEEDYYCTVSVENVQVTPGEDALLNVSFSANFEINSFSISSV